MRDLLSGKDLDGPAIRVAIRANRFAEKTIFITCERFARIASNLQFAIY